MIDSGNSADAKTASFFTFKTLSLLEVTFVICSNLSKQFGPRSGLIEGNNSISERIF